MLATTYIYIYIYSCINTGSPNITYYSNGITTLEGNTVNLICNATNDKDAIDPVQISWYNGTELIIPDREHITIYSNNDTVTDQAHSVLVLDNVSITDDGEYVCRASNDPLCYTENKIKLTVECKFVHVTYLLV